MCPHQAASGSRSERPDTPTPKAGPPDRRQVILLVEDHEADRDIYGGLLWYNGYDVIHAPDGASALEKASDFSPDLILLDIRLPGELNGLDVARTLRSQGLEAPIIVLSAVPQQEIRSAAAEAGVTAYIEKPVDPFVVVQEVMRRIGYARADDGGTAL